MSQVWLFPPVFGVSSLTSCAVRTVPARALRYEVEGKSSPFLSMLLRLHRIVSLRRSHPLFSVLSSSKTRVLTVCVISFCHCGPWGEKDDAISGADNLQLPCPLLSWELSIVRRVGNIRSSWAPTGACDTPFAVSPFRSRCLLQKVFCVVQQYPPDKTQNTTHAALNTMLTE